MGKPAAAIPAWRGPQAVHAAQRATSQPPASNKACDEKIKKTTAAITALETKINSFVESALKTVENKTAAPVVVKKALDDAAANAVKVKELQASLMADIMDVKKTG